MNKILIYSGAGYAFMLLSIPILTRLYTPVDMGYYAVFSSSVMLLIPIITMGNDYGILNEDSKVKARRYLYRSVVLALIIFLLTFFWMVIFYFFTDLIAVNYDFLIFFPVAAFLASMGALGVNWLIRAGSDRVAGRAIFFNICGRSIFQSIFGMFGMPLRGLLIGEVLGRFFAIYISDRNLIIFRKNFFKGINKKTKKYLLGHYSKYITPKLFLDNFIVWSPPFIVALMYGPEAGGLMAIVQRVGSTPVTIFNQSIGLIFHRSLVLKSLSGSDYILKRLIKNWSWLIFSGIFLAIILLNFSNTIFRQILGDEWANVGYLLMLTLPMYILQVCNVLCEKIFLYNNRLFLMIIINILSVGMIIFAFFCSYVFGYDLYQSVLTMSLLSVLPYILAMLQSLFLVMKMH